MARKKTSTTVPSTSPPPAPPAPEKPARTRQRQTAKARAKAALDVILRAVEGHKDSTLAAENLGEMLARLPDGFVPGGKVTGPLRTGDFAEPRPPLRHLYTDVSLPVVVGTLYKRGRGLFCNVVDQDGVRLANVLVSDLRRAAPPVTVPDVPQGDPAAMGDEPPSAHIVDLGEALKRSVQP